MVVAIGVPIADPLIGLAITLVILRITWQSWQTVAGHDHHDESRSAGLRRSGVTSNSGRDAITTAAGLSADAAGSAVRPVQTPR